MPLLLVMVGAGAGLPRVCSQRAMAAAYRWRRASGAPFKPRKRKQPIFARVIPTQAVSQPTGLVVEIGPALVRVESGFDANLLRAIVIALGSGST